MTDNIFLKKARALAPVLHTCSVQPLSGDAFERRLDAGASVRLDFGGHLVGYLTLRFGFAGSHPDAPAWIRVRFAERETELSEAVEEYAGWVSPGWVQQEQLHIDVLPAVLSLPRRYAFRYVQIDVLAVSGKYGLVLESAECRAVSSADDGALLSARYDDPMLGKIDAAACRTLHDCMQSVFEDGPKRDRRLWMGDLRLQALANYETYRNNDLVKRCLYLFAGTALPDGHVAASLFLEPEIEGDDMAMFDYSLLFVPALYDYWQATGDGDTLRQLWPTAWRQVELARSCFDIRGVVRDSDEIGWCFTDWNLALNKQASAQGIYLYCLNAAARIAGVLGDTEVELFAVDDLAKKKQAAREWLFDGEKLLFVSGKERQISWASQVWMVLGGVFPGAEGAALLRRVSETSEALRMVTPYMFHHYIEALLAVGEKDKALSVLREYWGGMINAGADTFWELYDPDDPNASPYGGTIVNSYCHAWSCAPAYFLRKYFASE